MKQEQGNWNSVHESFDKTPYQSNETYQQIWEENNFIYEDAKQWISIGFHPDNWIEIKKWKSFDFSLLQIEELLKFGLGKEESELADYLRKKNCVTSNIKGIRKEFHTAQNYLDWKYPLEIRRETEVIDISWKNLVGSLSIVGWVNLKTIDCANNQIVNLTILDCSKLQSLFIDHNQFISCDFLNNLNPDNFITLNIDNNSFPPQDLTIFSKLVNLEMLVISNNPFFGSLQPLQSLRKLRVINLLNTNIDDGLEYLPITVEKITNWKNQEMGIIKNELMLYKKENEYDASLPDYDLQLWRIDQPGFKELKNLLIKINSSLDAQEVIRKFDFFNVKTGYFYGNLSNLLFFFNLKQEETILLKKTIEILTKELKNHKQKIVDAYLAFCSEKELLKDLIISHLDYSKSKQQNLSSYKLRKKCDAIKEKLENKLSEEEIEPFMDKVEIILKDCEELIKTELELENKINTNKLIEDFRKEFQNLTINVNQGHVFFNNKIGDNANFSYSNRLLELSEQEFQSQIQIPPKSN